MNIRLMGRRFAVSEHPLSDQRKMKPLLVFGAEQGSIYPILYFLFFTYASKLFKKKIMKLVHQGLNYLLFNGHQYYWQLLQGESLDKSSYCLRHEVLDYDRASVTL